MKYLYFLVGALIAWSALPGSALAAPAVSSLTLNGAPTVVVSPGQTITVAVTVVLGRHDKWKSTSWGINQATTATPNCANTGIDIEHDDRDDNHHEDRDQYNHDRTSFTEIFTVTAPQNYGVYNFDVAANEKNNCLGDPGPLLQLDGAIRVGSAPLQGTAAFVTNPINSTTQTGVALSIQGAATETDGVLWYITDQGGHTQSGTGTTAGGSFTTVVDVSTLQDGPLTLTASLSNTLGRSGTSTDTAFKDTSVPVLSVAPDLSLPSPSGASTTVTFTAPTALDQNDGSLPVTCMPASGGLFPVGTTTVVCMATDPAGNQGQSSFDVGVYVPSAPLAVATFSPGFGSTTALAVPLSITFNQPVAASSVSQQTVQFWEAADFFGPTPHPAFQLDAPVTLSTDGKTVTYSPTAPLQYATSYYFLVPGGIPTTVSDLFGNQPEFNLLEGGTSLFTTIAAPTP